MEVDQAGDRLIYAAQLYHQGKAEHLLLSGGRIDWISSGAPPAEDMAALLEMLGVPRQALWLESQSRNTYENARNARALPGAAGHPAHPAGDLRLAHAALGGVVREAGI